MPKRQTNAKQNPIASLARRVGDSIDVIIIILQLDISEDSWESSRSEAIESAVKSTLCRIYQAYTLRIAYIQDGRHEHSKRSCREVECPAWRSFPILSNTSIFFKVFGQPNVPLTILCRSDSSEGLCSSPYWLICSRGPLCGTCIEPHLDSSRLLTSLSNGFNEILSSKGSQEREWWMTTDRFTVSTHFQRMSRSAHLFRHVRSQWSFKYRVY